MENVKRNVNKCSDSFTCFEIVYTFTVLKVTSQSPRVKVGSFRQFLRLPANIYHRISSYRLLFCVVPALPSATLMAV